ncbi:hypothetical protein QL285_019029 [Trifolium repens]|nr:hypothetical protein QL285_019029 [Trifolium repens]
MDNLFKGYEGNEVVAKKVILEQLVLHGTTSSDIMRTFTAKKSRKENLPLDFIYYTICMLCFVSLISNCTFVNKMNCEPFSLAPSLTSESLDRWFSRNRFFYFAAFSLIYTVDLRGSRKQRPET